jgi:hypothetical protein
MNFPALSNSEMPHPKRGANAGPWFKVMPWFSSSITQYEYMIIYEY